LGTSRQPNAPVAGNSFGQNLQFSPDGTTLAVGEYRGDLAGVLDAGTVQLFDITTQP